jgi:hypothetical protein
MVVLDHGVQGLTVPISGTVDLGIVAAGRSSVLLLYLIQFFIAYLIIRNSVDLMFFRHCLSLVPNSTTLSELTGSAALHGICFSVLSKRNDSSCYGAHRKLFQPKREDVLSFQEVVHFVARVSSGLRDGLQRLVAGEGRGIVIPGGGIKQLANVWVLLRTLRWLGCNLPVEIMYVGTSEMTAEFIEAAQRLGDTTLTDVLWFPESAGLALRGWPLKIRALMHSKFAEVIMLDADNVPLVDPSFLFSDTQYTATGALFWHDFTSDPHWISPEFWDAHVKFSCSLLLFCSQRVFTSMRHNVSCCQLRIVIPLQGLSYNPGEFEFESGQMVINRARVWDALLVAAEINRRYTTYYRFMYAASSLSAACCCDTWRQVRGQRHLSSRLQNDENALQCGDESCRNFGIAASVEQRPRAFLRRHHGALRP